MKAKRSVTTAAMVALLLNAGRPAVVQVVERAVLDGNRKPGDPVPRGLAPSLAPPMKRRKRK